MARGHYGNDGLALWRFYDALSSSVAVIWEKNNLGCLMCYREASTDELTHVDNMCLVLTAASEQHTGVIIKQSGEHA